MEKFYILKSVSIFKHELHFSKSIILSIHYSYITLLGLLHLQL